MLRIILAPEFQITAGLLALVNGLQAYVTAHGEAIATLEEINKELSARLNTSSNSGKPPSTRTNRLIEGQVFAPGRFGHFEITAFVTEVKKYDCGHATNASLPRVIDSHEQYGPATKLLTGSSDISDPRAIHGICS